MNPTGLRTPSALRLLALAIPLALAASAATAQDRGWYGGASIGTGTTDIDAAGISTALGANGIGTRVFNNDDRDTAWKVLGGYSFNPKFALELNYFDLGDFSYNVPLAPMAGTQSGSASISGLGFDLVGTLPLYERLSLIARLGLANAEVDQNFRSTVAGAGLASRKDRDVNEKYGLGLQYELTDAFSIRAEWERYGLDDSLMLDDNAETYTVGFVYRFGRTPPPPPPVVQAPEPTPAPPPPAPQPIEITLSASALFDFDRAELRPEGRQELDNLVQALGDVTYDSVVVVGHTDRIGTREYNLPLSERRANAVRDYMVQRGVPAARISARGVNSDQPVTAPDQCRGMPAAQVIACLQPDRRVVIEIHGTRMPD